MGRWFRWTLTCAAVAVFVACGSRSRPWSPHTADPAAASGSSATSAAAGSAVTGNGSTLPSVSAGGARAASAASGSTTSPSTTGVSASTNGADCDGDADTHLAAECGGDDCNDDDATIHPGADDTNATAAGFSGDELLFNGFINTGYGTSLAVDAAGTVHAANGAEGLRYANNQTGTFVLEEPDPASDSPAALVLGEQGQVFVAYQAGLEVRLATRSGATWSIETLATASEGTVPLAIDEDGNLHLAYASDDGIVYGIHDGAGFSALANIGSSTARPAGLRVHDTARPHLVYTETEPSKGLFYAEACESGLCETQLATQHPYARMALDARGRLHVISAGNVNERALKYHTRSAEGIWTSEELTLEGAFVLALEVWPMPPRTQQTAPTQAEPTQAEPTLHLAYRDHNGISAYAHGTPDNLILETFSYTADDIALALQSEEVVHATSLEFTFSDNYYVVYHTNRVIAPDALDQNCDGVDGVDQDGDGAASLHSGGSDCDDYAGTTLGQAGAGAGLTCTP